MGTPGGNHKLVDARDSLARIDEEPLPIQRDDLHLEGWRVRWQGLRGIEVMGCDPGHATQEHDYEEGMVQTMSSMRPEKTQSGR